MESGELVVLVDEAGWPRRHSDGSIRTMDKQEAHKSGDRHLAVSVFIFDRDRVLLQKRASSKYHSPGQWSNTCCTHPRVDERPSETAHRRLHEEMGISCNLREVHQFVYAAVVGPDLREHEYDHVFVGQWSGTPRPLPGEVDDWRWVSVGELEQEIADHPFEFTPWLRESFGAVLERATLRRDCFVVCPIGPNDSASKRAADRLMDEILVPVLGRHGFSKDDIHRADLTHDNPNIQKLIADKVARADLVVADLTGRNPNVFYELGLRHAIGGRLIQFTRNNLKNLPFDVSHIRTIKYNLDSDENIVAAQREFEQELLGQETLPPRALELPLDLICERFPATVLSDLLTKERRHYRLASGILSKGCKRIFMMQRSSTLILGPRRGWEHERLFYERLYEELANGAEFYHLVTTDGVRLHYRSDPAEYPHWKEAQARLSRDGDLVEVPGPYAAYGLRQPRRRGSGSTLNPDMQARVFVAELLDGTSEAVLVVDLAGLAASLHLRGPKVAEFMRECLEHYDDGESLSWKKVEDIFEGDASPVD